MRRPLFAFFMMLSSLCAAEQIAVLPDGNKIRVLDNGTWKPVIDSTSKKDSINSTAVLSFDSSCGALVETISDKMSGKSFVACKEPIIVSKDGEKGLVISIMSGSWGGQLITIRVKGAGSCINEGDKIHVLFTDNSRLELMSEGKFNCDAKAMVCFGKVFGKKAQLAELLNKRISAMRVWTNDSFVEEDFTKETADAFYYTLRCLAASK